VLLLLRTASSRLLRMNCGCIAALFLLPTPPAGAAVHSGRRYYVGLLKWRSGGTRTATAAVLLLEPEPQLFAPVGLLEGQPQLKFKVEK